ncbi:nucleoporin seh1 [Coccidioides immitis H538.4]|uniref:Nucleoporin seh1 n=3 Tax=Coccidioides immitis TaxID=5501 RepID=A0A0J8TJ18_COCIT|nr:nucleoporin seh1 [Coccidioides immitis RMSCC 2394]KMU73717.1 nucleoporin seh1 [Coccidioides immitis RMSCC 3703]KMU84180.1 nucleoporin seh1 [Coccidioides immitis H538.4]
MPVATEFEIGHRDQVNVIKFNFYGNRILTASSDHRVKVWDQNEAGWELIDTWRAHDAEIYDAAWNGPFTGQHIGTVGNDMKFKLWQEDLTQPPNSGRRFRSIFRLTSPVRTPYVSLDFRNIDLDSWLAVITRDGLLTVLEPVGGDTLAEWQQIDQFRVCAEPQRGEETSFKVQFHHDPFDMTHLVMPSWDSKSLSLVVAAMDTVKVYRMGADRQFYHAIELTGHPSLVRDVSWARGSVRGYDLIASGSKDGTIKIFEVYTSTASNNVTNGASEGASSTNSQRASPMRPATQSGIGSALASRTTAPIADKQRSGRSAFEHTFKEVGSIDSKHACVWQVQFSHAGDCLMSSGDDGMARFWKRAVSGKWLEFAEADMTEEYGLPLVYGLCSN